MEPMRSRSVIEWRAEDASYHCRGCGNVTRYKDLGMPPLEFVAKHVPCESLLSDESRAQLNLNRSTEN